MNAVRRRENFNLLLDELNLNGYGVEIGVAAGSFSEVLLNTTKLKKIYFVDPWKEYPKTVYNDQTNSAQKVQDTRYEYVINRLKKFGDRATIIRKESKEAISDFAEDYFDFIYIDANHAYEYVKEDISGWYSKLKVGGIFSGHDYMNGVTRTGVYGVKRAVDEFCKDRKITPLVTGGTRRCPSSWYFVKEK